MELSAQYGKENGALLLYVATDECNCCDTEEVPIAADKIVMPDRVLHSW